METLMTLPHPEGRTFSKTFPAKEMKNEKERREERKKLKPVYVPEEKTTIYERKRRFTLFCCGKWLQ